MWRLSFTTHSSSDVVKRVFEAISGEVSQGAFKLLLRVVESQEGEDDVMGEEEDEEEQEAEVVVPAKGSKGSGKGGKMGKTGRSGHCGRLRLLTEKKDFI